MNLMPLLWETHCEQLPGCRLGSVNQGEIDYSSFGGRDKNICGIGQQARRLELWMHSRRGEGRKWVTIQIERPAAWLLRLRVSGPDE